MLVVYAAVDKLPGLASFRPSTPLRISPVLCHCIYCTFVIAKVKLGTCDHSLLGVSVWWEDCLAWLAKVFCHDWIQLSLWSKILESRRPDCSPSLWHCVTARALWLYLFISPSSPAHSVAPSSEFRNDIPLARQACQVVSCAIVGCVINGDGQQLLPPFSSPLGATAGLKYVTVFVAGFEILRRCKKILVNFSIAMFSLFFWHGVTSVTFLKH